jgi:2-hydroxychromene-2-carboxylate isomerase
MEGRRLYKTADDGPRGARRIRVVSAAEPVFYFDVSSPYAYLAAVRIDDVLPLAARWEPIAFGALLRQVGKLPWSMRPETRAAGQAEIEARALRRGLPPLRWPEGWPDRTYSLAAPRAILHARDAGRAKELALALFDVMFVQGRHLADPAALADAATAAGVDAEELRAAVERDDVKQRLRAATDAAIARGVTGVPTVAVGERLFWGDDRLEEAAAALGGG